MSNVDYNSLENNKPVINGIEIFQIKKSIPIRKIKSWLKKLLKK